MHVVARAAGDVVVAVGRTLPAGTGALAIAAEWKRSSDLEAAPSSGTVASESRYGRAIAVDQQRAAPVERW